MNLGDGIIGNNWKVYLKNSGSMIEYNQMYLAHGEMHKYEKSNNIKYDYVIRLRTDVVVTKLIDFGWLNITDEQIQLQRNKVIQLNGLCTLSHIMNSLISPERLLFESITDINDETSVTDICDYIKNGRYILLIRKNLFFIVKRDLIDDFVEIGIKYGSLRNNNNSYWFNAESQLEEFLKKANITSYSSVCQIEDKSLYEYNKLNYFDNDGNLLNRDDVLLFIMRKSNN
jgi:hypothetical protein